MDFKVFLTADAAIDLEELHDYIVAADGVVAARHVLKKIESVFDTLSANPNRGNWPPELLDLGIRDYRELFFKPYRIIYRVSDSSVYVLMVVDGRRDLQSLLERRLFGR